MISEAIQKMRKVPLCGPPLCRVSELGFAVALRAREELAGQIARGYHGLGAKPPFALTIPQQWQVIRRNSGDLLKHLPPAAEPSVLFAPVFGGAGNTMNNAIESVLAHAVRLRGVRTLVIGCDRAFPACAIDPLGNRTLPVPAAYPRGTLSASTCIGCTAGLRGLYAQSPVDLRTFSEFAERNDLERAIRLVDGLRRAQYETNTYHDIHVGQHALASVFRALGRGTLLEDPLHDWLFRRQLIAGVVIADLAERALAKIRPRRLVCDHGIYVDHGIICEVARKLGIPVTVFGQTYRRDTVLFCHGDTYHRTLISEPTGLWENLELSAEQRERLWRYVDSRRSGTMDSVTYHPSPIEDRQVLAKELALDVRRPIVSLFTNVIWDAQLYHDSNAFVNLLDWLFQTIEYFCRRPDVQLVVRIHPAEVKAWKKTEQPVAREIQARFERLPEHIKIVPPESDLSSYTLVDMSQAALIYGTKMGLEIALRGVPVIIAGESFNRGKGFTYDVSSPENYFGLLDRITSLPRNSSEMLERAVRYGYHFYFRRQMDFPFVTGYDPNKSNSLRLAFNSLSSLLPGQNANLDKICEGLINGTECITD